MLQLKLKMNKDGVHLQKLLVGEVDQLVIETNCTLVILKIIL